MVEDIEEIGSQLQAEILLFRHEMKRFGDRSIEAVIGIAQPRIAPEVAVQELEIHYIDGKAVYRTAGISPEWRQKRRLGTTASQGPATDAAFQRFCCNSTNYEFRGAAPLPPL